VLTGCTLAQLVENDGDGISQPTIKTEEFAGPRPAGRSQQTVSGHAKEGAVQMPPGQPVIASINPAGSFLALAIPIVSVLAFNPWLGPDLDRVRPVAANRSGRQAAPRRRAGLEV